MRTVRRTEGAPRRVGRLVARNARSWQVLPECEEPFKLELRAGEQCRALCVALAKLNRRRRLLGLRAVWRWKFIQLVRREGAAAARGKAWRLVWTLMVAEKPKAES
jgi:hypothetical protein